MTVYLRPLPFLLVLTAFVRAEDSDSKVIPNETGRTEKLTSAVRSGFAYTPPKPEAPTPPPEEDKPKNEIVRLPNVVVNGTRPAVFSDRNLHTTRKDLAKFATRKYLSEFDRGVLNAATLPWLSNDKRALQQYYDEERKKNVSDLKDASLLYQSTGDEQKSSDTLKDANDLQYRPSSGGTTRSQGTWFGEEK